MKRLLILILLAAMPVSAQQPKPRKVIEQILQNDGRPCVKFDDGELECLQYPGAGEMHKGHLRPAGKAATLGFWIATGSLFTAAVLDVESTRFALRRGFQETNPIFGKHPSSGKLYGITLPVTALQTWGIWYIKDRPNRQGIRDRLWVIPIAIAAGAHGGAAAHNWAIAAGHTIKERH